MTENNDKDKVIDIEKKRQEKLEKKPKALQDFKVLRNYLELPKEKGQRQYYVPRTAIEILNELMTIMPRLGLYNQRLAAIVDDPERENWLVHRWLEDPDDLESVINDMGCFVDFKTRDLFVKVKWRPFFKFVKDNVPIIKSCSEYPTWPRVKDQLVLGPEIEPAETGALDQFINFFNPLTPSDRVLMKALVATVPWSEGQGKRPLFVIAGAHDADKTLQIGKSTFAYMIQYLYKSAIDLHVEMGQQRFVTDLMENAHERVIRLDNVRGNFDSKIIERFITNAYFQGHVHGVGNRRVENHTTFILTANDPNLTEDLVSRSVVIRLAPPSLSGTWLAENVLKWIDSQREAVLADCAYVLTTPSLADAARRCVTRFPAWERTVLHRLGEDVGQSIKVDQERLADRSEEYEAFKEFIYGKIISYKIYYDQKAEFMLSPDNFNVFIASDIMVTWYMEFTGIRYNHGRGSNGKLIKKLCCAIGMKHQDGPIRLGTVVVRGYWWKETSPKIATYAILKKRQDDPYATYIRG